MRNKQLTFITVSLVSFLLASCYQGGRENDSDLDNSGTIIPPNDSRVPIVLAVSDFYYGAITRGIGAFQDPSEETDADRREALRNRWEGTTFYVLSYLTNNTLYQDGADLTKTTLNNPLPGSDEEDKENKILYCLVDGGQGAQDLGKPYELHFNNATNQPGLKEVGYDVPTVYYDEDHQNFKYQFFIYHIDDAQVHDVFRNKTQVSLDISIDGTQDVLQGYAEITEEQEKTIIQPNIDDFGKDWEQLIYSTISGHYGLVPQFKVKHQLVQLRFNLLGADDKAEDVTVEDIVVKEVPSRGQYIVAADNVEDMGLSINEAPIDIHIPYLDEASNKFLSTSTDQHPDVQVKKNEKYQYTGGILLPPQKKYSIQVVCSQNVSSEDGTTSTKRFSPIYEMTLPEGEFEAGQIYDVQIKIYGFQNISVQFGLHGWKDSGITIPITTEEE